MKWVKRQAKLGRPALVAGGAAVTQALGGALALAGVYRYGQGLADGGWLVGAGLILCGAIGCGLSVLPTYGLALIAGWSVGWGAGVVVAVGGATLGTPLGYVVGGWLAGDGVWAWAQRYPRAAAVCRAVRDAGGGSGEDGETVDARWKGLGLLLLLRLSPVVPYGTTNVLAAVFGLSWAKLTVATAVGLVPRLTAAAGVGAAAGQLSQAGPGRPSGWLIGLGLVATATVVVWVSWVAGRALRRVADEAERR